jgi:16S rRNA (cytosine967-C5)-methyltransferase
MLHDLFSPIEITVSDIRRPILYNLEKRMQRANVKVHRSFVADLEQGRSNAVTNASFDIILADVPCTGSGTWARTPEQLHYFDETRIAFFAERQKRIVSNALPGLRAAGLLIYITCSVFRSENEDVVHAIASKHDLDISMMQAIPGYGQKADSMFIAILKKKDAS